MTNDLQIAIEASIAAGKVIIDVYELPEFSTQHKADKSPLTEADLASNNIITGFLENTKYPVINEEKKIIDEEFDPDGYNYMV